jgi:hypothetical protein
VAMPALAFLAAVGLALIALLFVCGRNAGTQFAADSHRRPRRSAKAVACPFNASRRDAKS